MLHGVSARQAWLAVDEYAQVVAGIQQVRALHAFKSRLGIHRLDMGRSDLVKTFVHEQAPVLRKCKIVGATAKRKREDKKQGG